MSSHSYYNTEWQECHVHAAVEHISTVDLNNSPLNQTPLTRQPIYSWYLSGTWVVISIQVDHEENYTWFWRCIALTCWAMIIEYVIIKPNVDYTYMHTLSWPRYYHSTCSNISGVTWRWCNHICRNSRVFTTGKRYTFVLTVIAGISKWISVKSGCIEQKDRINTNELRYHGETLLTVAMRISYHFLSLARSKNRLCPANHWAGYFSNLTCNWLSIVWAYFEHETENGPRTWYWQQTVKIIKAITLSEQAYKAVF